MSGFYCEVHQIEIGEATPGTNVVFSRKVEKVKETSDGQVILVFEDGTVWVPLAKWNKILIADSDLK